MQILLPIFYTLFFILLIFKLKIFKETKVSFFVLSSIFIIKIVSGVILALIYKYYYENPDQSDAFKYYLDGKVIFNVLKENPIDYLKIVTGIGNDAEYLHKYLDHAEFWYKSFNYNLLNDNRFVIRINAIISIISFGSYWVHSVIFSFLSFTGLVAIYRVFSRFINYKYLLLISVFFAPSVMFWSSSVLKESLIIAMLGMLLFNYFKMLDKEKLFMSISFFIISFLLMLLLKFYVLFTLLPSLIFYFIYKLNKSKNSFYIFSAVYLIIILLFFNSNLFTSHNLVEIISAKQHDFNNLLDATKNVGSRVILPILEPNFWSILKATPNALINSFFRPFFGDIHSVIVIPALFENILIILLILMSIVFFNGGKVKENLPIILFITSFVLSLFILIGLTTPVLGALVRYKVPALPFLFVLFLIFIDFEKIKKFFKKVA
jgi:hypothetical protein